MTVLQMQRLTQPMRDRTNLLRSQIGETSSKKTRVIKRKHIRYVANTEALWFNDDYQDFNDLFYVPPTSDSCVEIKILVTQPSFSSGLSDFAMAASSTMKSVSHDLYPEDSARLLVPSSQTQPVDELADDIWTEPTDHPGNFSLDSESDREGDTSFDSIDSMIVNVGDDLQSENKVHDPDISHDARHFLQELKKAHKAATMEGNNPFLHFNSQKYRQRSSVPDGETRKSFPRIFNKLFGSTSTSGTRSSLQSLTKSISVSSLSSLNQSKKNRYSGSSLKSLVCNSHVLGLGIGADSLPVSRSHDSMVSAGSSISSGKRIKAALALSLRKSQSLLHLPSKKKSIRDSIRGKNIRVIRNDEDETGGASAMRRVPPTTEYGQDTRQSKNGEGSSGKRFSRATALDTPELTRSPSIGSQQSQWSFVTDSTLSEDDFLLLWNERRTRERQNRMTGAGMVTPITRDIIAAASHFSRYSQCMSSSESRSIKSVLFFAETQQFGELSTISDEAPIWESKTAVSSRCNHSSSTASILASTPLLLHSPSSKILQLLRLPVDQTSSLSDESPIFGESSSWESV